jgi:hypothetical protein
MLADPAVKVMAAVLVVELDPAAENVVEPHPLFEIPDGFTLKLGNTTLIESPISINAFDANS